MSTQEDHSDDTALAGEYVLHLLDDADRQAFEARMNRDPALRDLVRAWETHFVALTDDIAPVAPPPSVKSGLQGALFADVPRRRRNLIRGWLSGGLVAAALAVAVVAVAPIVLQQPDAPAPSLSAQIAAEDGSLVVAASFIAETNTLEITREAGGALPGRVLELWLIAEGADAPVSLGVLPADQTARIAIAPAIAPQLGNAVLAISDEPPGGSPTGAPTGAVLAVGPVAEV